MLPSSADAGGKVILLGEHFVVYGVPALAVPLTDARTTVTVEPGPPTLQTDLEGDHRDVAERVLRAALKLVGLARPPGTVRVRSDIPVGFGLGSSAAFSAALLAALVESTGQVMSVDEHNRLTHELECVVHGRPSGIDDTVVTRARAVRFVRGEPFRLIRPSAPLSLVLGSCGYPGPTRAAVASVRRWADAHVARFGAILEEARGLVDAGQAAFEAGDAEALGPIMSRNHALLREVGVSTPELETLVSAALEAGALGAKLTGAGRGGFALALSTPGNEDAIIAAFERAGAHHVLRTTP